MNLHRVVLFLHIAAMIGLFVVLAIEWLSLRYAQRSTFYEQAQEWVMPWRLLVPFGAPSMLVALASGVYLAKTLGAWELGWVRAAIPMLLAIAIAGGVVRPRRKRIRAAIETRTGPMPHEVLTEVRHPLLIASVRFRATLIAALVFAMTARPGLSAALLVSSAIALGVLAGASGWLTRWRDSSSPR